MANKISGTDKKALKSGVWYTASSFLRKGIGFFSTPIFARLLDKSEFGSYSNFGVWLTICAIVCTLDLKASVSRAKFDFEDDFDAYISSITFFGTLTTGVFYIIVILFMDFFVNLLSIDAIYLHVMFIELLFAPSLDNIQAKHRIQMKYKVQVFLSIFIMVSSTLFAVLGAYFCKDRLFGRIMGGELVNTAIYIVVFIYIMYKGRKIIYPKAWKYAAVYSIPLIPHLLSNTILGSSDKAMITKMVGPEANGIYSLAHYGGMIISTFLSCFNQAMGPWLYEKLHAEDYGVIKKVNRYYIAAFSVVVMGCILLAPEIIWILGGKKYESAKFLVAPIMLGYGYKFAYTNYVNVEQYEKKTGIVSVGTLAAALFNVVTNLIFIPIFGFEAAAYTTLAGFMMLLLMHYLISRRYGFTRVYDNRFTFMVMVVMTAFGLLIQFIFPLTYVRWAIAFVMGSVTLYCVYRTWKRYFR